MAEHDALVGHRLRLFRLAEELGDETFEEGRRLLRSERAHAPGLYKGAEVVEFNPTDELRRRFDLAWSNAESAS